MAQRSSQTAAEAVAQPTSQKPRGSQLAAEAVAQPTSQKPRGSQLVMEVLIGSSQPAFPRGYW